jgi:hypothetical protein
VPGSPLIHRFIFTDEIPAFNAAILPIVLPQQLSPRAFNPQDSAKTFLRESVTSPKVVNAISHLEFRHFGLHSPI